MTDREHEELHKVALQLAQVKTDVDWLKRAFWVVAIAAVGQLAATMIQLARVPVG